MSQGDKAAYWQALKGMGVSFDKHYRDYKTEDLAAIYQERQAESGGGGGPVSPMPSSSSPRAMPRNEDEHPGERLNTLAEDEPIRVDEDGLVWYQEEVRKPASPRPRARRVLSYVETGTKTTTFQDGDFIETIEVAGDEVGRPAEVKITLPSYQVGIYKDPRFPFKVHIYNEQRGFDLFEVRDYYGGAELVPEDIKIIYVSNVLCYDVRTTIRAIQTEYRQLQLAGKVQ